MKPTKELVEKLEQQLPERLNGEIEESKKKVKK
jgi:hypothetical protein